MLARPLWIGLLRDVSVVRVLEKWNDSEKLTLFREEVDLLLTLAMPHCAVLPVS
jgi:hypothetical protein